MELDATLLRNFAIALFIGAVVGVDRERHDGHNFAGLRTFILIALVGAMSGWLGQVGGLQWLLPLGMLGLAGLLARPHANTTGAVPEHVQGLTTEMAALLVYLLGAGAVMGYPEISAAVAVAASALLTFKDPLHNVVRQLGPDDVPAVLKLLFASLVVLPLLPDRAVDPWEVINPFKLWWLVVLVSGLSLLGYIAVRVLGERAGLLLTGLFGGLVSSTAVTWTAARQAKAGQGSVDALAASILLAWTLMFARVPLEVAFVEPSLLPRLVWPMLAMGVVAALGAVVLILRDTTQAPEPHDVGLKNPFSLVGAVQFGAFFAAVLMGVEAAHRWLDPSWLYAIAALAGTTDVDAITLSMAEAAGRGIELEVAAHCIVIAAFTNSVVKTGIAAGFGGRPLGMRVGLVAAVSGAAGLLAAWWL